MYTLCLYIYIHIYIHIYTYIYIYITWGRHSPGPTPRALKIWKRLLRMLKSQLTSKFNMRNDHRKDFWEFSPVVIISLILKNKDHEQAPFLIVNYSKEDKMTFGKLHLCTKSCEQLPPEYCFWKESRTLPSTYHYLNITNFILRYIDLLPEYCLRKSHERWGIQMSRTLPFKYHELYHVDFTNSIIISGSVTCISTLV